MATTVTPYNTEESKKEQVASMFDNIAHRYDFLNQLLSLGIHKTWRRKAIAKLIDARPKTILDVATGTGDFAIEARKRLQPDHITGVDISEGMLNHGRVKLKEKGLDAFITLQTGDSENLPFPTASFDAVTVAFGVRNFENLRKGLSGMFGVLKPGGTLVVLEFSRPRKFPIKQLYSFYFLKMLPFIGKLFSKDSRAYTYLPESVNAFPDGETFLQLLREAGYTEVTSQTLTLGIASIYTGRKAEATR